MECPFFIYFSMKKAEDSIKNLPLDTKLQSTKLDVTRGRRTMLNLTQRDCKRMVAIEEIATPHVTGTYSRTRRVRRQKQTRRHVTLLQEGGRNNEYPCPVEDQTGRNIGEDCESEVHCSELNLNSWRRIFSALYRS